MKLLLMQNKVCWKRTRHIYAVIMTAAQQGDQIEEM